MQIRLFIRSAVKFFKVPPLILACDKQVNGDVKAETASKDMSKIVTNQIVQ